MFPLEEPSGRLPVLFASIYDPLCLLRLYFRLCIFNRVQ
jgi:hypothetical protein